MTLTLRPFASGMDHPEGLAYSDVHGLVCGGEAGQIYAVDLESGAYREVANTGGFVLGLAFGPEGKLYVCDMVRNAVLRIDVETGEVADMSSNRGVKLSVPNHLVFAPDGNLYVSDSGTWGSDDGRVIAFAPNDGPAAVIHDGLAFANGLALDAPSEVLYVVESRAPGVGQLALTGPRSGEYTRIIDMPGTVPDGLAVCTDGSLVISCYRPDAVYSWSTTHGLTDLAADPLGLSLSAPTNVAFVGADRDRLVTANLAGRHLTEIVKSGRQGMLMRHTTS
jgi:gluconolactonase